jgi:hypothetical protein
VTQDAQFQFQAPVPDLNWQFDSQPGEIVCVRSAVVVACSHVARIVDAAYQSGGQSGTSLEEVAFNGGACPSAGVVVAGLMIMQVTLVTLSTQLLPTSPRQVLLPNVRPLAPFPRVSACSTAM